MATIEIPVLRKKEEERRGGAVPPPLLFRTAGVRFAAGAPNVAGSGLRTLFWGLNGRGGLLALAGLNLGSAMSRFSAAELAALGTAVLAAFVLGWLGLAQALDRGPETVRGWAFESRPESPAPYAAAEPMRPAPGSLIAGTRLSEEPAAESRAEAPSVPSEPAPAPEPASAEPAVDTQAIVDSVAAETKGRLVAGTLGRGAPGVASGASLRDSLNSFSNVKTFGTLPAMKELGRLTAPPKGASRRVAARLKSQFGARSTRAMGQLKFARNRSLAALGSVGNEPSSTYAAAAFDQAAGAAGSIGGIGLSGGEVLGPLGGGAPDLTEAPSVGPTENKTPYQDKVDNAKQNIAMALALVMLGLMLMAVGAMVLMYAKGLLAVPEPTQATKVLAAKLMKFGIMLLAAGALALAAGGAAALMAKQKGKEVSDGYGQPEQGDIIDSCAGQAVKPKKCKAPGVAQPVTPVHEAVVAESTAGWSYDNGGPVSN